MRLVLNVAPEEEEEEISGNKSEVRGQGAADHVHHLLLYVGKRRTFFALSVGSDETISYHSQSFKRQGTFESQSGNGMEGPH